jgi:hypothetical protein
MITRRPILPTGNTQDSNAKPHMRNDNTPIITHRHTNVEFKSQNLLNILLHETRCRVEKTRCISELTQEVYENSVIKPYKVKPVRNIKC